MPAANAINNILYCGSIVPTKEGRNRFDDEFDQLNLKDKLEEVLQSEESSPYLKFAAEALLKNRLRKTTRANKWLMKDDVYR